MWAHTRQTDSQLSRG